MKRYRKSKFLKFTGLVVMIVAIGIGGYLLYVKLNSKDPIPASIKNQLSFKVVFPASTNKLAKLDSASYDYQAGEQLLTYKINYQNTEVIFSQQPSPDKLGSGDDIYYPAIGIHPYAQFKTNLGQVALTKLWESGSLDPAGQSAVLSTQGTLVTANTHNSLTNEQWKDLFSSLKISP